MQTNTTSIGSHQNLSIETKPGVLENMPIGYHITITVSTRLVEMSESPILKQSQIE